MCRLSLSLYSSLFSVKSKACCNKSFFIIPYGFSNEVCRNNEYRKANVYNNLRIEFVGRCVPLIEKINGQLKRDHQYGHQHGELVELSCRINKCEYPT